MHITELFSENAIALDFTATSRAEVLDKLTDLQCTHGNITDRAAYKAALCAREEEASTYVDGGITVPHAMVPCVTRPGLAALRLAPPLQYSAGDADKTSLLFAIAAPMDGSLHVDMLARLMQMLIDRKFVEKLQNAKTSGEFLACINAREKQQFGAAKTIRTQTAPVGGNF